MRSQFKPNSKLSIENPYIRQRLFRNILAPILIYITKPSVFWWSQYFLLLDLQIPVLGYTITLIIFQGCISRRRIFTVMNKMALSLTTNNNKITVFVSYRSVASSRVRFNNAFYLNFLPQGNIFLTNLLYNPHAVNIIKELLTCTLPSVNVNAIINYTTAMRVSCLRYFTDLLALNPS